MLYPLYRFATDAAEGLFERLLRRRLAAGKEEATRIGERRGAASRPRPAGRLVWLHAASVGEANSLLPLIAALQARLPEARLLLTTGTMTSAGVMAERLPPPVMHQFVPLDAPAWVARFFDHWRPDLGILVESELWPNLLGEARRQGVALALLNARLSPRSAARWRALKPLARSLMEGFALIAAQSQEDAARFTALGGRSVRTLGNLKYAGAQLPVDPAAAAALAAALGERPRLVFASTHAGEEDLAVRVHRALKPRYPQLLTIIAPRHPARAGEIAERLAQAGEPAPRRSTGALPHAADGVYLADTLGELGTIFAAAKIVVMGGSFAAIGGHNPLEPAAAGCAVIAGPHMENFAAIAARLEQAGALIRADAEQALTLSAAALLAAPDEAAAIGENGRRVVAAEAAVLERLMHALEPLLAPLAAGETGR
jgi:3-deoxy-D-manno-octulosonic-acid transferase